MSTNPLPGPLYAWFYFAAIMTTAFYGVACMQIFFYYIHYSNDLLRWKILVAVIFALNTIHEGLIVDGSYKYISAGLANPLALSNWVPELHLQMLVTTLVAILTQGFLMYRIYVFSGKKIVTLIIWFVLSLLQFVPITIYVAKALYVVDGNLQVVSISVLNDATFKVTLTLSLSVAAGEDILIAMFLVFLLVRQRNATSLESTLHMLQRLTVFSINTGTWTALFAVLSLLFMYVWSSELLYTLFALPLCSIYCNTVLANLNARTYLKDRLNAHVAQNIGISILTDMTSSSNAWYDETKLVFAPTESPEDGSDLVHSKDRRVASLDSRCLIEFDALGLEAV